MRRVGLILKKSIVTIIMVFLFPIVLLVYLGVGFKYKDPIFPTITDCFVDFYESVIELWALTDEQLKDAWRNA